MEAIFFPSLELDFGVTLLEVIPAGACPELDERVPGSPFLLLLDFAEPLDFVPGTEDEDLPLLDPSLELRMTDLDDDDDLTFWEEDEESSSRGVTPLSSSPQAVKAKDDRQ